MITTFEQQLQLVKNGLAIRKDMGNLSLFKYHRHVMFDALWSLHPETMECRGHVYNNVTGQIVTAAPRKSFNYLENGWWKNKPMDTWVRVEKKFNGYLACATYIDNSDELLVTTTGSFDSEFQKYAYNAISAVKQNFRWYPDETIHFEIIADFDPHIVKEEIGVHRLAHRHVNGTIIPATTTRSDNFMFLSQALELAEHDRGEGFMLYDTNEPGRYRDVCKMKTPYYIGKKKLMRMSKKAVENMYAFPIEFCRLLPRMWQSAPEMILDSFTMTEWQEMDEQSRRRALEQVFG